MFRSKLFRPILLSASILAAVPIKCNSILEARKPDADSEYEYIYVTGHSVPQKVKKGSQGTSDAAMEVSSGESVRNGMQKFAPSPKPLN
jgi:hypothetical protein